MKTEDLALANDLTKQIEKLDSNIRNLERALSRPDNNEWRDNKDYRCIVPLEIIKPSLITHLNNQKVKRGKLQEQLDNL